MQTNTQQRSHAGARGEAVAALRDNLHKLNERDSRFAGSLLDQLERRGLSQSQWDWIPKLAARAQGQEAAAPQVGDVAKGVNAILARASERLQHPKLRIATGDDIGFSFRPLVLSVAGQQSKVPGSINVTSLGAFEERVWYGRVTKDGVFHAAGKVSPGESTAISRALVAFAADPAEAAARYGRLTGHCCFCGRHLDDPKSTALGYGPVCAKKWGV